jgi:hypothetical protein
MTHQISTRALLEEIATGDGADLLSLGELLDRFSRRSFGLFLLLVLLPVFIPVPVGIGAICGPLVSLIGVQLLLQFEHPWLPRFVSRRQFKRQLLINFQARFGGWLQRLEKLSRPRLEDAFDRVLPRAFSGLLLILLGFLLALPLPGTNYPFGLIILLYALGLIERDGAIMAIGWLLGLAEIVLAVFFSSHVAGWVAGWFG